jgi:phosphatidylserine/phosphatidylglycerophosphate/cardiolipin synthase-like enzyme
VRPDWTAIEPGDLVMFEDEGGINHVAIYVGHARIIHSSETGGGVRYDDLGTERGRWFASHLAAARRIAVDGSAVADLARGFSNDVPSKSDGPDHAPKPRKRN